VNIREILSIVAQVAQIEALLLAVLIAYPPSRHFLRTSPKGHAILAFFFALPLVLIGVLYFEDARFFLVLLTCCVWLLPVRQAVADFLCGFLFFLVPGAILIGLLGWARGLLMASPFMFWISDYLAKRLNDLPTDTVGADLCFGALAFYASSLFAKSASGQPLLGDKMFQIILLALYNVGVWLVSLNLVRGPAARSFIRYSESICPRQANYAATFLGLGVYFLQVFYAISAF